MPRCFQIRCGIWSNRSCRFPHDGHNPENRDILYTASEAGGGVYKSKDGGASWYEVNVDLADTSVIGLAMDPERPKTLYVSGPTGVYKTVTGGE